MRGTLVVTVLLFLSAGLSPVLSAEIPSKSPDPPAPAAARPAAAATTVSPNQPSASAPIPPAIAADVTEAERLETAGQFGRAISLYEKILPGNEVSVLWRLCRATYECAEAAPEGAREALFDRAVGFARRAVAAVPLSADAHALLAVVLGRKALHESTSKAIEISREVKAEADRALALDKDNFIALLVLGLWNRQIAGLGFFERTAADVFYGGLPEASLEASARNLERAVRIQPRSIRAHYELAVTYRTLDESKKALEEARAAVRCPASRPEDPRLLAKARELEAALRD